eukprot:TRINITY_DN19876_c0_g2_i1.p1 TRINITY_DN19876_c0_g2~~TRINITY_DN19876_c0_g2_i1.p1  ORF type:complete len:585 (+),score=69.87 TRINITY_DN19876_c0_g2_i1:129-1757(+)
MLPLPHPPLRDGRSPRGGVAFAQGRRPAPPWAEEGNSAGSSAYGDDGRWTCSFPAAPTQTRIEIPMVAQSWAGPNAAELRFGRYHGAIERGPVLPRRRRQATELELQPVVEYYQRWQNRGGGSRPPFVVAFVNSRSGNQKVSRAIKTQLLTLLGRTFTESGGQEVFVAGEVCELSEVSNNPTHVRDTIRDRKRLISGRALRFLVCGGDGTVTWVLQEVEACKRAHPNLFEGTEEPPIGIVPAGTGNDLARSLGWGSKLARVADLVGYMQWVLAADVVPMDQWKVRLRFAEYPPAGVLPPAFHWVADARLAEYEGCFTNYFSVGMDAAVMFGVERCRSSCLGKMLFGLGIGKIVFGLQAPRAGIFDCCGRNSLSIHGHSVQVEDDTVMGGMERRVQEEFLGPVRQLTLTNINSYGAGRVVYSDQDLPDVRPADGRIELFTVGSSCSFGLLMGQCRTATLISRTKRLQFTLDSAEYVQMDGEAWLNPLPCEVEVTLNRRVQMLRPPACPQGIWRGRQTPGFWRPDARQGRNPLIMSAPGSEPCF